MGYSRILVFKRIFLIFLFMGYSRRILNSSKRIRLFDLTLMISMHGPMAILMDIMWPISQSHFHVSCLCSLK